ncbi:MAG: NnrS family protein [Gammaproteobacteria bacterium]|nr:NnrS family protein [Gammaproteobacteria bacterium]
MHGTPRVPLLTPALLVVAPHRLLFFTGAVNVLLAMLWWALWLSSTRWQWPALPQPPIPAGWAHSFVMTYQLLTPFMFGFLLTVFPRWMNQPALSIWQYGPVGAGLFCGQLLTLAGLLGFAPLLHAGVVVTILGWVAGIVALAGVLWRDGGRTWHAVSVLAALGMGLAGLVLFAGYLHDAGPRWLFASVRIGVIGLLLPVFFTVCHRMVPFFAGSALRGYALYLPMAALAICWPLLLAHLALELVHGYAWLWLADLPLAALAGLLAWRWWPRQRMPGLLAVLFIGFAWLPVALLLFAAQSLWLAATGEFVLGRAPVHALTIGFCASLLVAMVTRVTQGHSGRPLQMPAVAWIAFVALQLVAVLRIGSELLADPVAWQAGAAVLWLVALAPWASRLLWIYLTPRLDGNPG